MVPNGSSRCHRAHYCADVLPRSRSGINSKIQSKSDNPFAYFTAAVTNSFVRIINLEKRNQNIRDDLLEINGMNPSYSRTGSGEHAAAVKRFDETTD